jgi:hypothetical protein
VQECALSQRVPAERPRRDPFLRAGHLGRAMEQEDSDFGLRNRRQRTRATRRRHRVGP